MVERPIGRAIVIVCVLRVAFSRRRHLVLGGVLITVADWGQFVDVGVFLIYLTWVAATGRVLGVLGSSLEFGRAPVLVKSSQKLKIGPIF